MRVVGLPPLGAARGARLTMLAPGLPVLPELLPAPEVASQLTSLLADSAISSTADDLAGSLFGASLFPWLAMLYWLKHPTVAAPPGVAFGLTFLLAFVFGTIPATIGAGALYGVSLADADYLHGAAESLLAITNCVVVLGFRDALRTTGSTTAAAAAATSGAAAAPAGAADDEAATARAQQIALDVHRVLGLKGLSRTDLRMTGDGTLWFLEVNTMPGMTDRGLVPLAAKELGIDFRALIGSLIRTAATPD